MSSSMREECRSSTHAWKVGSVETISWRSSLENWLMGRGSKDPLSSGFLFPDGWDEDSEDLRRSLLTESDDGGGLETCHLDNAEKNSCKSYILQGSHVVDVGFMRKTVGNLAGCENAASRIHRSQTAPAMSIINRDRKAISLKRPEFTKGYAIVMQAGVGLLLYLAIGIAILTWKSDGFFGIETFSVVDSLYFCVVTICTVGYGGNVPVTPFAKLFSCIFVMIGFGFIDALISNVVTFVLDKQRSSFSVLWREAITLPRKIIFGMPD